MFIHSRRNLIKSAYFSCFSHLCSRLADVWFDVAQWRLRIVREKKKKVYFMICINLPQKNVRKVYHDKERYEKKFDFNMWHKRNILFFSERSRMKKIVKSSCFQNVQYTFFSIESKCWLNRLLHLPTKSCILTAKYKRPFSINFSSVYTVGIQTCV